MSRVQNFQPSVGRHLIQNLTLSKYLFHLNRKHHIDNPNIIYGSSAMWNFLELVATRSSVLVEGGTNAELVLGLTSTVLRTAILVHRYGRYLIIEFCNCFDVKRFKSNHKHQKSKRIYCIFWTTNRT